MQLGGILPPVTTPFENEEPACARLAENIRKWNATGLSGYLILGSNSETVYMEERERLEVIETARQAVPPDKLLMVGTGLESTRETIRFSVQAARLGADCVLVLTPCYFKGAMKPAVLYDHYLAVAEASQVPVLLYNVPQFTGVNLEAELVARLSEHPNIAGIKDSSGNIMQLADILRLADPTFNVFVGSAPVLFPALCLGAVGGILAVANAAPEICVQIFRLHGEGRYEEARALQQRMTPLAKAVTMQYGIGGLKAAMDLAGYYGGAPRLPLRRPEPAVESELQQLLANCQKGSDLLI